MTFAELDALLAIADPMERARQGAIRHGRSWERQAVEAMPPGVGAMLARQLQTIVALQRRIDELEAR